MQSDALRDMNIRKVKIDRKDCVVIAGVLRFGRYTETVLPDEDLLQIRELSRCRVANVEFIAFLINIENSHGKRPPLPRRRL